MRDWSLGNKEEFSVEREFGRRWISEIHHAGVERIKVEQGDVHKEVTGAWS